MSLLEEIEAYLIAHRIGAYRFGYLAVNNGRLVERLRAGGDVTTKTAERVRAFMNESGHNVKRHT
jgi:hypothetical protein